MIIDNGQYCLTVSDDNGAIKSFRKNKRELIAMTDRLRPLFVIRIRDEKGVPIEVSSLDAEQFSIRRERDLKGPVIRIDYEIGSANLSVQVQVACPEEEALTYWNLTVENRSDKIIDWISFPNIVVPNDLIATGGDGRVFHPGQEGAVVEDIDRREGTWMEYKPVDFPYQGWLGYYPSVCPMQFMAYYGKDAGLYLAAHDPAGNIKSVEYHKSEPGGIALNYGLFPGGVGKGVYKMPYDMVLGVFEGDWYDAADIYRMWMEDSDLPRPAKIHQNKKLPDWFEKSPVVVTYPVRGTHDLDDMTPNEYYPYTNAIGPLEKLSDDFDSPVLALLMHWEGTAPWAPPYVWPPFGDEKDFREFVEKLHAKGNLAGVYGSGIGWTVKSNLVDYNREKQFEEENLKEMMTVAPDGEVRQSLVCNGPNSQRWGYDMCPSTQYVEDIVIEEVNKIIESGCDYIQYFDQNLGGAGFICYGKKHGHPPAPGIWLKEAMVKIYKRLQKEIKKSGRDVLIGCESAAAETFLSYLLFNDVRFEINFLTGTPVPAYAYVYHEYVNNFMGNQVVTGMSIDLEKSPLNLHQRMAYSFVAGDMLTVVLKGKGKINWDWGTAWDTKEPDQESLLTLTRNLNAWRKGIGKDFICHGRMQKPYPLTGTFDIPIILNNGDKINWPSVFTSRWTSPDNQGAQILVNYTTEQQNISLCRPGQLRIYTDPYSKDAQETPAKTQLNLPPLSAVLVEFIS